MSENCYDLVHTLSKHIEVLSVEITHYSRIVEGLQKKLKEFSQRYDNLLDRLKSLWDIASSSTLKNIKVRNFADEIYSSWIEAKKRVYLEASKYRISSMTVPGISLISLIEKIRKEAQSLKISLQIAEVIYDEDYVLRGYSLFDTIIEFAQSLEKLDDKVHQYVVVCKLLSHLNELELAVNKFISTTDVLSMKYKTDSELDVFPIVIKLLTGELLDLEETKPNQILTENALKKPVVIIKGSKRKFSQIANIFTPVMY